MENSKIFINYITTFIEIIGCITIFTGVLYSLGKSLLSFYKRKPEPFIELRQTLGKSILFRTGNINRCRHNCHSNYRADIRISICFRLNCIYQDHYEPIITGRTRR
jgi:hypothetical protein